MEHVLYVAETWTVVKKLKPTIKFQLLYYITTVKNLNADATISYNCFFTTIFAKVS